MLLNILIIICLLLSYVSLAPTAPLGFRYWNIFPLLALTLLCLKVGVFAGLHA